MKTTRITLEQALFILAFSLALGVRFLHLGAAPLSDFEASGALQAFQISRGESVALSAGGAAPTLTGLIFFIFGSSDFTARLWPALAGSLLVWLPYIFRQPLGKPAALAAAFGLALDPGLVAASRLAGGPMIAMGFGLLAIGLALQSRIVWAGIFGGLALLGGPAALQGVFILTLASGIWLLLERFSVVRLNDIEQPARGQGISFRIGVSVAVATVLIAGTLFFRYPQGLGALAGAVPDYLRGWISPADIPAARLLAAFVFYQPLAFVFGLIGAVRGWIKADKLAQRFSIWALVGLGLTLLYPGRQVVDISWVIVPFWGLAALEMARHFNVEEKEKIPSTGQAILIFCLLVLSWLNLASLTQSTGDSQTVQLRWLVVLGTLLLGIVTTLLMAMGWSKRVAQRGLAWGAGIGLGLYVLASMWGVSNLRQNSPLELWTPSPETQQAKQVLETLGDLSEWRTGINHDLDIVVVSSNPSLHWALRDWKGARYSSGFMREEMPSLMITPEGQSEPSLAAAYRGQDFAWGRYPDWNGALPQYWPNWLVFRQAPVRTEKIILWARSDLFPEGSLLPAEESPLPAGEEEFIPGEQPAR